MRAAFKISGGGRSANPDGAACAAIGYFFPQRLIGCRDGPFREVYDLMVVSRPVGHAHRAGLSLTHG